MYHCIGEYLFVVIEVLIYDGTKLLWKPEYWPISVFENSKEFDQDGNKQKFFRFLGNIKYSDLNIEWRLAINVWWVNLKNRWFLLGSAGVTIFNSDKFIKQEDHDVYLWPFQKFRDDLIWYGSNRVGKKENRARVTITFKAHGKPLKHRQNK